MAGFFTCSSLCLFSVLSSAAVTDLPTASTNHSTPPSAHSQNSSSSTLTQPLPTTSQSYSPSNSSSSPSSSPPSSSLSSAAASSAASAAVSSTTLSATASPPTAQLNITTLSLSPYGMTVVASVGLFAIVLVVCSSLLCIYKWNDDKRKDTSAVSRLKTNESSHIEVPLSVCEFDDTCSDPPSSEATGPNLVPDDCVSSSNLPIVLSDDYSYITTEATIEDPIYTSADLPGDEPSDSKGDSPSSSLSETNSPEDAVYSTTELPTILMNDDDGTCSEVTHETLDLTYHLAQLPMIPGCETTSQQPQTLDPNSVSLDNDYSLSGLPKELCNDSPYSLAQLPRTPSGEAVYSNTAEEPIYSDATDDPTYYITDSLAISHNPLYSVLESTINPLNGSTHSSSEVTGKPQDPLYSTTDLSTSPADDAIYSTADGPLDNDLDCEDQLPTILSV